MSDRYREHPVMFKSHPFGFILSLILIPAGIGILILLWWYLQNKASQFVVTDTEVIFEKGLLSKEHAEINIGSVRTVKVKQSLLNRIFNVGTIEIYTAGDEPEIVANGMPDPNKVREVI